MGGREDPAATFAWAKDGAEHLRGLMARLGDSAFGAPSGLPGWTRAHLLTHVARNADELVDVLETARTGTPGEVRDAARRAAEIEEGARRTPEEIRADVVESSDRLADAVRRLPEKAWSATVEYAGRRIPATEVLWLRAVETWVHAVDLDVGASFVDLPQPMLLALIAEAAATVPDRSDAPALVLVATGDPGGRWTVGEPGPDALEISGSAAELAEWLTGRASGRHLRRRPNTPLPELAPWR